MPIKSLQLQNFLSFGPDAEPLELRALNVLIGANGSGKSNFLEAVGILQAAPTNVGRPLVESMDVEAWRWRGNGSQAAAAALFAVVDLAKPDAWGDTGAWGDGGHWGEQLVRHELTFSSRAARFALIDERVTDDSEGEAARATKRLRETVMLEQVKRRLTRTRQKRAASEALDWNFQWGRLAQSLETLRNARARSLYELSEREGPASHFWYKGDRAVIVERPNGEPFGIEKDFARADLEPEQSILAQFRDPERYPTLRALAKVYESIAIYREWTFGRKSPVRIPQNAALADTRLLEDGSNLGLVLRRVSTDATTRSTLLENLRAAFDGIRDFEVEVIRGSVHVALVDASGFKVWAGRLSDGTLRWLSLLLVLLDPSPPGVVCIEEPELGLHPDLLPTLARVLKAASLRTQLIVTTHSEVLVDALSETPEDVLVCDRRAGSSQISRLDRTDLKEWLEQYRLGQLWSKGVIGGNRW